jgi:hypothetical protein
MKIIALLWFALSLYCVYKGDIDKFYYYLIIANIWQAGSFIKNKQNEK